MLTPKELFAEYSRYPCEANNGGDTGRGTPYDIKRFVQFIKHLKYPCFAKAPNTISGTGTNKLGLTYRFLTRLDAEAFEEIQPSVESGTSHAIRNACDIARACFIEDYKKKNILLLSVANTQAWYLSNWESRMATEYIQHFAGKSLYDGLMMLGPDIVDDDTAMNNRATGCGDMDCFKNTKGVLGGAIGAAHSCSQAIASDGSVVKECASCGTCPEGDDSGSNPCCSGDCVKKVNECCGAPGTARFDFSYLVPSEDGLFGGNIFAGWTNKILKHIGILKRKSYGGYANFIDNSGSNFYACKDDLFLQYFQGLNSYYYDYSVPKPIGPISTMKTISVVTNDIANNVKDLLYNGYGVLLFSNVGFPNYRDSTGLSYPDRNWYHTMSIIGYDDRKLEYPECVFLIANSWGEWNSGGEPSWGPIPKGSFLITETHLNKMTQFNRSPDFIGCQSKFCPTPCYDRTEYEGCTEEGSCVPFECAPKQRAFGLIFALSFDDGFVKKDLNHKQFYKINKFKANDNDQLLYFEP